MRKIILLFVLSLFSITVFAQQKKVAVYVTGEDAGVNKVLGSKLISAIARSEQYTAIERTDAILAELSKELNYQQTGAVDNNELSLWGKQFGVQYVCVASVFSVFGEQYISARLIDVETAHVEQSASSSGAINSLDGLILAANDLSRDLLSNLGNDKQQDVKKVAVYVVRNDSGKDIGRVLGDKLVAGFTNSGRYVAVERSNSFLSQLRKEQDYQQTGAVDDHDISRIGKQFGVQYVCVADVTDVFGEKFISARLIDVETAETVNTFETGGELRNMKECLKMTNDIASNLSKGTFVEQAEDARVKAEIEAQIKAEQDRKNEEETRKKEQEEKERLKNRPWMDLLKKVTTNVTKKYDNGECYIGEYQQGRKHGIGLDYLPNRDLYCGFFEGLGNENNSLWSNIRTTVKDFFNDGEKEGMGMYIVGDTINYEIPNCPKSWVYVGKWDGNDMEYGKVYNCDGKLIYWGKFHHDKPKDPYPTYGYAEYSFRIIDFDNGDKYIGELKNGRRSGVGLYIWGNGNAWYGEWCDNKRNGYGIFMSYEGGFTKGTWENDKQK